MCLLKPALPNVLSIIEPIYYPDINGSHYHLTFRGDPNPIFDYMEIFSPSETLQWLGWTPSKIKHLADTLLMQVGNFDPLIKWHSLTQFIYPNKLDELRGDALLAVDYKIAAEMLLRFYEDLVELKIANPLPSIPPLGPSIYQKRLNPTHRILDKLDSVLMDFGISPHPSLIIVLEGQSEMEIVPKVMKILGIPYPSPFIKLFCIKGIDNESPKQKNKFQILAEYVALPELKNDGVHKFLSFTKPPVNFWVLTDAESLFESEQKREGEKKKWIDGLFDNLPKAYRISQVREILEKQVVIKSWDDEIFEFAHYSDQEIAQAILDLFLDYSNPPKSPSLDDVIGEVKKRRNNVQGRNLEKVLTKWLRDNEGELPNQVRGWELSKVALANKLWPVLEKKIRDAQGDATKLSKIPVARLLLEAEKTWAQTHRDNVVIPFNE